MSKSSGGTRNNTGDSIQNLTVDNEWDGSVLHGEEIRLKASDKIASRTYERAVKAILEDMEKRQFPKDVVGNVTMILEANLHTKRGGQSYGNTIEVQVMADDLNFHYSDGAKAIMEKVYHEIGHQIHQKYFPRWTAGAVNGNIGDGTDRYNRSPRESFARAFADKVLKTSKITSIADIISYAKKAADSDKRNYPVDKKAYKEKIKRINEKIGRYAIRKDPNTGAYTRKVWMGDKMVGVRGGKLVTIAENKRPD